jgi:hypothetical protein
VSYILRRDRELWGSWLFGGLPVSRALFRLAWARLHRFVVLFRSDWLGLQPTELKNALSEAVPYHGLVQPPLESLSPQL